MRRHSSRRPLVAVLLLAALMAGGPRGHAQTDFELAPSGLPSYLGSFNINIIPGSGLSANSAALAAFNRAADRWETLIADPITVNINADLASLGAGILGSASSVSLFTSYATIRNQMVVDASNEPDDGIVASLPSSPNFTVASGQSITGNLELTKANAKALGFSVPDGTFGVSDGSITFSTNFNFDFDNSNGIPSGFFDFESVAAHEIGHVLGFVSSVDDFDAMIAGQIPTAPVNPTTLDTFRFADNTANDPATVTDFSLMPRNLVPGVAAEFDQISATGGGLIEILLSTGVTQGDGRQASHWKDGLGLGIMDPTLAPQEISLVLANDARALDLIGYEINTVPESRAYLFGAIAAMAAAVGRGYIGCRG